MENGNGAGQVENTGAHSKDLPAAKERRAGSTGAFGPGPCHPCLLVSSARQAAGESGGLSPGLCKRELEGEGYVVYM